jgi:hypothetical protein
MGKVKLKDLVKQVNAENAPPDGWHPEDQLQEKPKWRYRKNKDGFMGSENRIMEAPKKRRKKKKSLIEQMNDYYGCEYIIDGSKLEKEDKPEAGKVYALTGGPGSRCIANGDTWKESEVAQDPAADAGKSS